MYDFQKANMWKRISAALCDFILLAIVVVGMALLLSTVLGYDNYVTQFNDLKASYEEKYEIDLQADYNELSDEDKARVDEADKAFAADPDANYVYGMIINYTFIIVIFSILIGYLLVEFIIPLLFKNGQTLGKKIFGVAVMREDGVRLSPTLLFVRTVLGKYTVETMIPVLIIIMVSLGVMGIIGTAVVVALLIAQIVLIIVTKARTPLHDKLAHTVTVDYASQMIFDTPEEMIAYKKRIHAESVENERN